MRFATVNPRDHTATLGDFDSVAAALRSIELDPLKTDHGLICRACNSAHGLGLVFYEFGMFTPPRRQSYFAIGMHLFAGAAVIYAFDERGVTVDVEWLPAIRWFDDAPAVERAILAGEIVRPHLAVDDEILWRWPEAAPDFIEP